MSNELIVNASVYILKLTREVQKCNTHFKLKLKYQQQ